MEENEAKAILYKAEQIRIVIREEKTVILRVFDSKGRIFFFQRSLKGIKKVESNSQKSFLGGLLFRKAAKVAFCKKKNYSFISILFLFFFFKLSSTLKNNLTSQI